MSQTRLASVLPVAVLAFTMASPAADDPEQPAAGSNRLARESSPYLLLHAHNPVDWYPWGPEAFEKAKRENKPIFLSVGYSSCYWCHVMEREVFSNEPIAKYMNQHFVNIKVDREERPDVDDIYMTSLLVYQQLTGHGGGGGWPLSMFLTPAGDPIAGATYLPPEDSPERGPGFPGVAKRIAELWRDRQTDLVRTAELISGQVQRMTRPGMELEPVNPGPELLQALVGQIREMYDPVWGGVDFRKERPNGPRFPNVPRLELMLDTYESTKDPELLGIVEHSLTMMARGGIRDHLGGGFHRYSTDRRWHVPHFEKMLYDQAMLLGVYARAAGLSDNPDFRQVAAEISDFVQREMTTAEGAFCSAFDAETNAIEGEYYVWSAAEIQEVLGEEDARLFGRIYGLNESSPFEHGFVLHLPVSLDKAAEEVSMDPAALRADLARMRAQLLRVRAVRQRPLLDDKVLTSWNAMMIRALAYSGRVLDRPQDTTAAAHAAEFLLSRLRAEDGHLLRTWRNGVGRYPAYLDDYAFLAEALLELHCATGEARWLDEARNLAVLQNELFYDEGLQAYYFTASDHEKLIARTSTVFDSVFPAANSVSIRNLLAIDELQTTPEFRDLALRTLTRFAPTLKKSPAACAGLGRALHTWLTLAQEPGKLQSCRQSRWSGSRYQLTLAPQQGQNSPQGSPVDPPDEPQADVPGSQVIDRNAFKPVLPAEPTSPFVKDDTPKPLKVRVYPMYSKLPRGGKCLVAVELQIGLGWHINANPSSPDFLVPTKLELKTKQKIKLTRLKYPKHHELKVDGFDDPYHVYDGKVLVYGLLEIDEAETAESAELEFHVTFQGCNSTECLPPDKVIMKGKLPFAAKNEPLKKINQQKFPKPKPKTGEKEPAGESE